MARSYERDLIEAVLAWDRESGTDGANLEAAIDAYYTARDADPAAVGREGVDSVTGKRLTVVDDDGYVSAMLLDGTLGTIPIRSIAPPPPDPITTYARDNAMSIEQVRHIKALVERGEL